MGDESLEASFLSSDVVEIGGGFLSLRRVIFRSKGGMPKMTEMFVDEVANAS